MLAHCTVHAIELTPMHVAYFLFKIKISFQLKPKLQALYRVVVKDNMVQWLMKTMSKCMKVSCVFV